jgi:sporulation protein YlmC with PRC-barrel domain
MRFSVSVSVGALALGVALVLAQTTLAQQTTAPPPASRQQGVAPGAAGFPDTIVRIDVTKIAQGIRVTRIIGKDVENDAGEEIGEVNDLIINPTDKVTYAIIGVGGFLGMGERLIAVPFEALKTKPNDDDLIFAGATKERIRQLPEFRHSDR